MLPKKAHLHHTLIYVLLNMQVMERKPAMSGCLAALDMLLNLLFLFPMGFSQLEGHPQRRLTG